MWLTSSKPDSTDPHWARLHRILSNDSTFHSFSPQNLMRITHLLVGSTGGVYKGSLGGELFAVKIVEVLGPGDISKWHWLQSKFEIYGHLERAYSSEKLAQCITPQCYGTFESKWLDDSILELHDSTLSSWDYLTSSEWWVNFCCTSITFVLWSVFPDPQYAEVMSSNDRRVVSYMFRGKSFIVH